MKKFKFPSWDCTDIFLPLEKISRVSVPTANWSYILDFRLEKSFLGLWKNLPLDKKNIFSNAHWALLCRERIQMSAVRKITQLDENDPAAAKARPPENKLIRTTNINVAKSSYNR